MAASKSYNVTVRGINLKIRKDILDDIEVVELLGEVQEGNVFAFTELSKLMFGDEGYQKVKRGLATDDGRTRVTDMSAFLVEVLEACNALAAKN